MTWKLYELPIIFDEILSGEMNGEPLPEDEQIRRVRDFLGQGQEAIDSALEIIQGLENEEEIIKQRINKWKNKREARSRMAELLRDQVLMVIDQVFNGQYDSGEYQAHGRKNTTYSLDIDPKSLSTLPDEAKKITVEPIKSYFVNKYKNGEPLPPGVKILKKEERTLVIK